MQCVNITVEYSGTEPLKGKLYRVDQGVKIFRSEFRTAPGERGVSFAIGQTVLMQSEPG